MKSTLIKVLMALAIGVAPALAQVPDFLPAATYPTNGSSAYAAVGDFNGDGLPDIATVESASQSLSLLFGQLDGTFQAPVSSGLSFPVTSITAADFNRDGKADLALTTSTGVAVLINAGDGSFGPPAFYGAGIIANYVAAADLDHDGNVDLAVAGGNGFAILRGLGTGAFTGPLVLPQAFAHYSLILADFNNDGNVDLLGDGSPGQFYAGNGDGTFAPVVITPTIMTGSVAADFNGDGKLDVASFARGFAQERATTQTVSIFLGTGDGQFLQYFDWISNGSGTGQVAAGDFNADGYADVAVWLTSPARLLMVKGGSFQTATLDSGTLASGSLIAADVDGNGAADLLLLNAASVTVIRDTHGNPPLLAVASVNPTTTPGGAVVQGTVTLGGPAPAGGAVVILSSSDPFLAVPVASLVAIPEGSASAAFSIQTSSVASATPVTVSGTWNSVTQSATLNLVAPYTLTGLTVNPTAQFGVFTVQGTVTLSGPADASAVVSLVSSNPAAASVPVSVTVPAGAVTASFTVTLRPVTANTGVAISASMGGVTQNASLTVLQALDSVQITKSQDTVRSFQLKVEATSTSASATLGVWNTNTGAFIGTLSNAGGGKYTGTFTVFPAVLSITVKSSLGGASTAIVPQK
jgi:hypothetical protein